MARPFGKLMAARYDEIKARDPTMTAKRFLDIVAPSERGRSEKSSRDYIRRLRSGERSGTKLEQAARQSSGKVVVVHFDTPEGMRSANIRLPMQKTRLDLLRERQVHALANKYLEETYGKRSGGKHTLDYKPMRKLPKGSRLASVSRTVKHQVQPAEVLM